MRNLCSQSPRQPEPVRQEPAQPTAQQEPAQPEPTPEPAAPDSHSQEAKAEPEAPAGCSGGPTHRTQRVVQGSLYWSEERAGGTACLKANQP